MQFQKLSNYKTSCANLIDRPIKVLKTHLYCMFRWKAARRFIQNYNWKLKSVLLAALIVSPLNEKLSLTLFNYIICSAKVCFLFDNQKKRETFSPTRHEFFALRNRCFRQLRNIDWSEYESNSMPQWASLIAEKNCWETILCVGKTLAKLNKIVHCCFLQSHWD